MSPNKVPMLTLIGGAGTVASSKTLIDSGAGRVRVDYGFLRLDRPSLSDGGSSS